MHRTAAALAVARGDFAQALASAREAIALDRTRRESWLQLGAVERARAADLSARGEPAEAALASALDAYSEAESLAGGDVSARVETARTLASWPARRSEATAAFRGALALAAERGDPDARYAAATAFEQFARSQRDVPLVLRGAPARGERGPATARQLGTPRRGERARGRRGCRRSGAARAGREAARLARGAHHALRAPRAARARARGDRPPRAGDRRRPRRRAALGAARAARHRRCAATRTRARTSASSPSATATIPRRAAARRASRSRRGAPTPRPRLLRDFEGRARGRRERGAARPGGARARRPRGGRGGRRARGRARARVLGIGRAAARGRCMRRRSDWPEALAALDRIASRGLALTDDDRLIRVRALYARGDASRRCVS